MPRCPACPGLHNCVGPDGPPESDVWLIGEKPGVDENRRCIPFVGKTGREVNEHYLPLAGLRRETVHIRNAICCWGGEGGKDKIDMKRERDRDLLMSCANTNLFPDIQTYTPKLLVPMGAFACYALDPEINLEIQHGIPTGTKWGTVFPMYHPAQGVHEPKKMLMIRTDWDRLRKYLRGRLTIPVDPFDGMEDYRHFTDPDEVSSILAGHEDEPFAGDTETRRYSKRNPHCLTFSVTPGTGYMILAEDSKCLQVVQAYWDRWKGPILFHNWAGVDFESTAAMGLRIPYKRLVDTMALAFHLGNLPQGLKALAYRELGMGMLDFDDVVTPNSTPLVMDYYRDAFVLDWPKREAEFKRDVKTGGWKLYKPQSFKTKIRRFFTDYEKNPSIDVFERWDNWDMHHAEIEERLGQFPGKCITHVPFEEALWYAARDADALLRLYPILRRMKSNVRHTTQENWRTYEKHTILSA